jgi:hypothetical protein
MSGIGIRVSVCRRRAVTETRKPTPETGEANGLAIAGVAQLVEHQLPKLRVAGSSPVARFDSHWESGDGVTVEGQSDPRNPSPDTREAAGLAAAPWCNWQHV